MKNTIDAINDFKAVWPDWANVSEPLRWCVIKKQYFQLNSGYTSSIVCTKSQFNRVVKRLGKC